MELAEAMRALERAGTAQTRKTWARHGAPEPMFGVSFADLGKLVKRADQDHDLAVALWKTGNADARQLAVMIEDSSKTTEPQIDAWLRECGWLMTQDALCGLVAETPWGRKKADAWRKSRDERTGRAGWVLVAKLALRQPDIADDWFDGCLGEIEAGIAKAPNRKREGMNSALISIGCRSEALRKKAFALAGRIGKVEIDHGDTSCKTPDAAEYVAKTWVHAKSKGFASPAAQEQARKRAKGSGCAR